MFRKEIAFEGYLVHYYETSCLEKWPAYYLREKGKGHESMKRWFQELLKQLVEKRKEEPEIISFDDIIPKQVYERMLQNPMSKFRFRIIVEAEEIC
ncbi:MAG: hypothetical protein QW660_04590 [Candidatus Bathyarchaeia archaeon]